MAAFFTRAFFELALPVSAIGSNVVELAAAGSDWVGSAVGGSSVGSGFLITNVIFGTGVQVDGAFGDLEEGEGRESVAFLLRARVRGAVGWWWRWY